MRSFYVLLFWVLWPLCVLPGFFIDDDGARLCPPVPDGAGCVRPAQQRYLLRRRRYWRHLGLYIKGRGTLRSGEQMHRRHDPLASFAPSGNTDKLAKLYV